MPTSRPTPRRRSPAKRAPAGGRKAAPRRGANGHRSWMWRYRRVLFAFALLIFTALAGALYMLTRVPLPAADPDVGRQTSFLTDINGVRLASLDGGVNRVNTKLKQVPPVVVDAILSTEDRNFFDHGGVDPIGIARATVNDLRGGKIQGGSTITQQYVKNVYVGNERTIWRKLREAALAVKIEQQLDKREILERYLNTIYLGRGAYGLQAASRVYFGKDVGEIGLKEAAFLAGIIRSPQLADPWTAPKVADARRDRALASLVRDRKISKADRDEIKAIPVQQYVLAPERQEPQVVMADKGTQYYVEYVRKQLVDQFGEAAVFGSGLRIKTSLDLNMQRQAYDAVYGFLNRPNDPSGALVAIDDQGYVKAMVGGHDWANTKVNLAVGRDGGGTGRQAGSTFKPFLLSAVVKAGYTVESAFPAPAEVVLPKANNGVDYKVRNYENADYGTTPMNLVDATRNSVNTVYAQVQAALGPEKLVDMAKELGIKAPLAPNASLVLGTSEVSVIDMAGAFSTFARRGVQLDPRVIVEVRSASGRVLYNNRPKPQRVLESAQADVVNFTLRQVVERGSGTGAAVKGTQIAGKTGTTQAFGDAWFIGYSPKLTTAVWMGYPEGNSRKMTNVRGRKVNGGSFPATIFRRFFEQALKTGDYAGTFPDVTRFPGKVLKGSDRITFSTTTSSSSTSSTSGVPVSSTTTEAPKPKPTTTVAPTTTAKPPPPTSTTAPGG